MKKKKVIIVGCRNPVFVSDSAEIFKKIGWDIEIVFRTSSYKNEEFGEFKITSTLEHEPLWFRVFLKLTYQILSTLEKVYLRIKKKNTKQLSSSNLIQSWSVAKYINKSVPNLVYVHAAYDFIMVNSFLKKGIKSIVMPWGGDIYEHVYNSKFNFNMVKKGLNQFDIVAPASVDATNYVVEKFNVPKEKVFANKYLITGHQEILDLLQKSPNKSNIKNKFNLPENAIICTNIRRLKPKWGSEEFILTAKELIKKNSELYFICITGADSKKEVDEIKSSLDDEIRSNILFVDRTLPLVDYLELLYISDLGISLMHLGDMRSSSIMASFALGLPLVLSKQNEYLELEKEGFIFNMVDYKNIDKIVDVVNNSINTIINKKEEAIKNQRLIEQNYYAERGFTEMIKMLNMA